MQYFGGKFKIAKDIVVVLEQYRKPNQLFVEPFVGAANIVSRMTGERHAYDIHKELIAMYKALQKGWIPPETLSKDEYDYIRSNGTDKLKAFAGFGCSFGGKYFGGYAKNIRADNYARNARNSLLRKIKTMQDVKFECKDYRKLEYENVLIYCDPPYANTTKYKVGDFDSEAFWQWCRDMSKTNTVIISEYIAPADFKCIWQKKIKTEIRTMATGREDRIEKLFVYCGGDIINLV